MATSDAERQRKYREKLKQKGLRRWVLWVTDKEREAIKALLAKMRRDQ